jgi:hypothetical protein
VSRLPPVDPGSAPEEARVLFEQDQAIFGQPLNSTLIAAYRPSIAGAVKRLGQAVGAGTIPDQLRFLINVHIASLVGCPF